MNWVALLIGFTGAALGSSLTLAVFFLIKRKELITPALDEHYKTLPQFTCTKGEYCGHQDTAPGNHCWIITCSNYIQYCPVDKYPD